MLLVAEILDVLVVRSNLGGEFSDKLKDRRQHGLKAVGYEPGCFLVRILRAAANDALHRLVTDALELLKAHRENNQRLLSLDAGVPIDGVVQPKWKDIVVERDAQGVEGVNRINYEVATIRLEDQEVSVLALHLRQNFLVYVSALMLQNVLGDDAWLSRMAEEDLRALSPPIHSHVNPYGSFELDMAKRLRLDGPAEVVVQC